MPSFFIRVYHYKLALLGAILYGFPSRKLIVIGVTGTSGKSTTVEFITKILEQSGHKVGSMSSVRFKIGQKEWKNNLKMTMPGRFKIQKFLRQAANESCKYAVLEVTSEGIRQFRHKFISFDTAVFTNLSPEHIESHGGFENYRNEKLKLFKATKNTHIINIDDENAKYFLEIPAKKVVSFGKNNWQEHSNILENVKILGEFNKYNAMAAIAVAQNYGISLEICKKALEKVKGIPGRMEIVSKEPLVVVDYAHTPDQLEKVYKTFSSWSGNPKSQITNPKQLQNSKPSANSHELADGNPRLICVLGSCGGGRDKWKRPELGKIAQQYCKEIIITNEDPYDEDPLEIMEQVAGGVGEKPHHIVIDRKEAIKKALELATPEDAVIITGKGSEVWMCIENGKKIPWDDREIAREAISKAKKLLFKKF